MATAVDKALRQFCEEIYSKVLDTQNGCYENVFLSPVSIYAAMAMVLAGSRGNTKQEMLSALQLNTGLGDEELHRSIGSAVSDCFKSTPGVTVSIGNRLFAQQGADINANYKSLLMKMYNAESENVNFQTATEAARERINQWVSEQTKHKIKQLFAPGSLKPDTCVAITNALYFKGSWEIAFPKEATNEDDFFLLDGSKKKMKMMFKEDDFKSTVLEDFDSTAVKLPFKQSKWEMLIVLPNQKDGLKSLLPKLRSGGLAKVLSAEFYKQKTMVLLPRFKLSENEGIDAKNLLMKLGMTSLFSPNVADLTGICASPPLFVTDVKHKAILEVDEEGATAAAATGVAIALCCLMPSMEVRVDHPFFVALLYNDTLPIFVGHVTDPEFN